MFHYYGKIQVYNPGAGSDNHQGLKFSININLLSNLPIPSTFYPLNSVLPFIPIQMQWRPKLTLRKIDQGHHRVMIYINYNGPASPMLHTKLCVNRPTGSGEEDF